MDITHISNTTAFTYKKEIQITQVIADLRFWYIAKRSQFDTEMFIWCALCEKEIFEICFMQKRYIHDNGIGFSVVHND